MSTGPAQAQEGSCPEVPYPLGVDVGAATVRLQVTVEEGRAVAMAWEGPDELVAAVQGTLGGCQLPPDGQLTLTWDFPEPPIHVTGTLWSRGERARLAGVAVAVGDRQARTDEDGRFALRSVAPGAYPVRVADPRWTLPEPLEIELGPDQRIELELWAVPDRAPADELVATYRQGAGTMRTVGIEAARALPGTLGDPLRALASEPGLARSPYEAGWLLVRGGEYDETGLFLDGVRVPLIYHLGGFTSVLHPEMIASVRFWPGLFPSRYGGALSGAADLVPRSPGDRARAVGGLNVVFAHAFVETPTPFGGLAVAARRSWLDGVFSAVLGPESAAIAPRFWDVSSRAAIGRSTVTLLAMQDTFSTPSLDTSELLTIRQRSAQLQATLPVGELVQIRPWLAWSRREIAGGEAIPYQRIEELYPGLRAEARGGTAARWTLGFEGQRHLYTLEQSDGPRTSPLWTADPHLGLAAGTPVELWSEVRLHTAVVEDDPRQPVRAAFSPRAGARAELGGGLLVRTEWGRNHQLPLPQLLLPIADGVYLDFERSDQWSLGASLRRGPLALDLDGWIRHSDDLAELEQDLSIGPSQARASGLESRLQLAHQGFLGSILYQYTDARKREDPGDAWQPSPFETPHRLELLAVQHLPRTLVVSARFRYVSGFPRLRDHGELVPTQAYDLLKQRAIDLPDSGERLSAFHSLDLRVGRQFTFRSWELEASLDVQNVYSRRVVEPVITGFGESRPGYGFGLPLLPIFALEGRWWPSRERPSDPR